MNIKAHTENLSAVLDENYVAIACIQRRIWAQIISSFVVIGFVVISLSANARPAPSGFADLAENLLPAVVNISTTKSSKREDASGPQMPKLPPGSPFEQFFKDFFDKQQKQQRRGIPKRFSQGSGFIIEASGLIVTNNHVIDGADEISIVMQDKRRLSAKVVGRDSKTDLALLRIKSDQPLPFVKFGNSDSARVGDWVLAIGNPFGLGGTVTAGIISARARNINAGPYDEFIQTDASINRGNSGGPMFNLNGEVIGINTAIFSPSGGNVGIGFSIPSNLARAVIMQLKEFGEVRRGWLGVRIQSVTEELAESLGLKRARGALLSEINKGGPAEQAKLQVGDVILAFDRKSIEEVRFLPRIVAETPVGKVIKVTLWRKGQQVDVDVKLGELPKNEKISAVASNDNSTEKKTKNITVLGLTIAKINNKLRSRFKLGDKAKGVIVTKVDADSTAVREGVRAGDVVKKIGSNQVSVTTTLQILESVSKAQNSKQKRLLFLFERRGNSRFVALLVGKKKS